MTVFRQIMIIYSIWVSVVPWLQTLCKPEKIFLYTRLINSIFLFFSELFVGRHENISILFADICKFTELTTTLSVDKLVETLNDLFGKFDDAADVSIAQYILGVWLKKSFEYLALCSLTLHIESL